jgi:Cu2+-containing amine oxidase
MLDIKQFSSDQIDSSLDILTVDEKLLVFKEIKIIFTRYDFDLLFPVGNYQNKKNSAMGKPKYTQTLSKRTLFAIF